MSSSVKALIDQAIQPESPYLKMLQERGLVRRDLTEDDLKSEPVRGAAVEQALILFAVETQQMERQEILAELQAQTAYSEARRGLRREYNAEFGSRVWNEDATRHFDTLVNRSMFVPPEEMRNAAHALSETEQRLIAEKSYLTELEKRTQARPSAKPGASFKP